MFYFLRVHVSLAATAASPLNLDGRNGAKVQVTNPTPRMKERKCVLYALIGSYFQFTAAGRPSLDFQLSQIDVHWTPMSLSFRTRVFPRGGPISFFFQEKRISAVLLLRWMLMPRSERPVTNSSFFLPPRGDERSKYPQRTIKKPSWDLQTFKPPSTCFVSKWGSSAFHGASRWQFEDHLDLPECSDSYLADH